MASKTQAKSLGCELTFGIWIMTEFCVEKSYSGGSKTKSIKKQNVSKLGFRMVKKNGGHFVQFSNGPNHGASTGSYLCVKNLTSAFKQLLAY